MLANDLVDYGLPITPPAYYRVDFLMEHKLPDGVEIILTNSPFKLAEKFVAHALELCPFVVMLLRWPSSRANAAAGFLKGVASRVFTSFVSAYR